MGLVESVRRVDGLEPLLALLRDELAWPVEPAAALEDYTFTWNADELRLDACAARHLCHGVVRQLRPFAAGQPWGVFLVEFTDGHVYRSALRQVLRGLVPSRRRDADLPAWQHENLLFLCTTREYDRFTFAHFRGERLQKARLATFGWEQGDQYVRTLCEYNLPALAFPEDGGRDTAAWLSSWAKAFDKEPLTRVFFKRFEAALEAVQADLQNFHKLPSAQAYSRAQLLLERMIFCYFLQNRGWLAQDRNFLIKHFETFRGRPEQFTYYQDFLERLFWSLATPPRSDAFRFSDVPFLNGGLFDDDEFAPKETRKKQDPPLKIRNSTFAAVFNDLLEAFNFTVCEDTPLNQDVAVDPEMLGKVFESIVLHAEKDEAALAPDRRKSTGSYYTPRIVVHFICREALLQWLKTQLGDQWTPRLKALFEIDPTDGLSDEELASLRKTITPAEGTRIAGLLKDLKCCDPAVGSGAFPVGLLHELVNLRRVCEAAAGGYVDPVRKPGTQWVHETKANIVKDCLYGVDIQQQAIEICRLRLWLSLVVDYDLGVDALGADKAAFRAAIGHISQLPNLEMNFHRGDSLHDHVSGVPIFTEGIAMRQYDKDLDAIRKAGDKLHKETKGERKLKLRLDILAKRLDLTERVLSEELRKLKNRDAEIAAVLFGGDETDAEKRRRLAHEMQQIQAALYRIREDRKELKSIHHLNYNRAAFQKKLRDLEGADFDSPYNFAWRLDLPAIFAREPAGFDIVVGNPPFVTARDPVRRELYRQRWPQVCHKTYQLLAPFFQCSFTILRPSGQLGFIVSNAFGTRDFGRPLVERLLASIVLQKIIDCSGLMFPGHGTPTCIVFARNGPADEGNLVGVVGIRPGGGDLRTPPEESPLWQAIAEHHDDSGYEDGRVVVTHRKSSYLARWPWRLDTTGADTQQQVEKACHQALSAFLSYPIGRILATSANDIYQIPCDLARRACLSANVLLPFSHGEDIRDWQVSVVGLLLKPYSTKWSLIALESAPALASYLRPFRKRLGARRDFGGTSYDEAGRPWYEYHQLDTAKIPRPHAMAVPLIATHCHIVLVDHEQLFDQGGQIAKIQAAVPSTWYLTMALGNSSTATFWLKQVCFSKRESEKGATDTYFEFAGGKIEQLPVPESMAKAMQGGSGPHTARPTALSEACWQRGRRLQSLVMRKVFEKTGECYHGWNTSLPGHEAPHEVISAPFTDANSLRAALKLVIETREKLRAEMIARQEELDWLVYQAYGLCDSGLTIEDCRLDDTDLLLAREERPFCLWAQAKEDYDKAVALIPAAWSASKKELWRRRLAAIRDNEHVRRIEQPVYKRRWDEQWKVGNRWQCGQPAYDAEFLDAFSWWLSEKAEWHLEHVARGPLSLDAWTAALWSDSRIQAAWPVAAEAIHRLEVWKESQKEHPATVAPDLNAGRAAFAKFFKALVKGQTVPEDIPFAVPWDDLEKKKVKVPAYVRRIRGKLNVPRERFWLTADGHYRQAQPFGPPSEEASQRTPASRAAPAGQGDAGKPGRASGFGLRSPARAVTHRLDLKPAAKPPPSKSKAKAASVRDLDRDRLRATLLEVVGTDWMERDEAIRAAAERLGFARLGKRIRKSFRSAINSALRRGELEAEKSMIRRTRARS